MRICILGLQYICDHRDLNLCDRPSHTLLLALITFAHDYYVHMLLMYEYVASGMLHLNTPSQPKGKVFWRTRTLLFHLSLEYRKNENSTKN